MPERILVVMPNWFGETLFATPFLRRLHEAYPKAFIAAMGVQRCQEVLAHNPHVAESILYEERDRHRSWMAKRKLIGLLRVMRFDAAFILRRSLERTFLLACAGIPRRIGFANLKSGWLLTQRVPAPRESLHKAAIYLHLLGQDGHVELPAYEYYPSASERAQATALLRKQGLPDGRPMVVLHPGANWFHKRWSPERFTELANRLTQAHAVVIVLTGTRGDEPLIQAMAPKLARPPIILAGQTTFRLNAACLEQASLVISNDTGMLHVAAALKRPVVALYGPTSPAITGPLGDPARTIVIHHPGCCPTIPCFSPDRPPHTGMSAISVDEVASAAARLLHETR